MIPSNVIHRVFKIRYGDSAGTAFTIEVEGREYLVTAKHLAQPLVGNGVINVFSNGDWSELEVNLVGHAPDDAAHPGSTALVEKTHPARRNSRREVSA